MMGYEKHVKQTDEVNSPINIAFVLIRTFDMSIYGLVTLTMYHLYLGLAFVNRKYDSMQNVRQKQVIAQTVFITLCTTCLLILIPSLIDQYWAQQLNNILECIIILVMFIVSSIIFIKMQL